jgi:hypothetical protein
MTHDVVVLGAGLSGLACARELQAAGRRVLVLERSRGVGGRCATRRVDGQPVDHGVGFLHGRGADFLAAIEAARDEGAADGWPHVREGEGSACRPAAFEPGSARLAPAAGVIRLPKRLAEGLDVRLETNVESLAAPGRDGAREWELLVLALPVPSAASLLTAMSPRPAAVGALLPVLALVRTFACLAVIARYPQGTPPPAWDAALPADGRALHLVLHDSGKRPAGARLVLVLQAKPRWSGEHLQDAPDAWAKDLLAEAAARYGAWIASPERVQPHAWRRARVAEGTELSRPLAVTLAGGAALGLCGDGFDPAGGLEGAWRSGRRLAARMTQTHTD